MAQTAPVPSAQDYLDRAKKHFEEEQYGKAKNYFEKACVSCPCNKDERRRRREYVVRCQARGVAPEAPGCYIASHRCTCKNLLAELLSPGGSVVKLAGTPCKCDAAVQPCDKKLHISALNGACASCEMLGDFKASFEGGLLMLHMAPRMSEGYLRAAKMGSKVDLQKLCRAGHPIAAIDARRSMYKHALANFKHKEEDKATVKLLQKLLANLSRTDPLACLPDELKLMIFSRLSLRDKLRCSAVSRSWAEFLRSTTASCLWQHLEFSSWKKPSTTSLKKLLKRSNALRDNKLVPTTKSIILSNWEWFGLDDTRLKLLATLPMLEKLELQHYDTMYRPTSDAYTKTAPRSALGNKTIMSQLRMPRLKRLSLHNFDAQLNSISPLMLTCLDRATPLLESLEIGGFLLPGGWPTPLENLRVLKLAGHRSRSNVWFRMINLDKHLPRLEQLFLDTPTLRGPEDEGSVTFPAPQEGSFLFPSTLQTLVIGTRRAPKLDRGVDFRTRVFPPLPPSLRVLDLGDLESWLVHRILRGQDFDEEPPILPKLEFFRFRDRFLEVDIVLDFLRPSMESGSLRVVDIGAPLFPDDGPDQENVVVGRCMERLASPTLPLAFIRAVGLNGYSAPNAASYRASRTTAPFADWVARFPNVDTVHFYPEPIENAAEGLVPLLSVPGVKRIYQNCLRGVLRDEVLKLAKKKGVEIVKTEDAYFPLKFPCVLDGDDDERQW